MVFVLVSLDEEDSLNREEEEDMTGGNQNTGEGPGETCQ